MKKIHFVAAAILVFAFGSAFTATKFVAEPKVAKPALLNTYYVTGKGGTGSGAYYNISTTAPANCGQSEEEPCRITTSLTLGATAPQSTVNSAQVKIEDRHSFN